MSSSEFTIGLDGSRVSSKVLRPPGGVSSDIFGLGSTQWTNKDGAVDKNSRGQEPTANTQNRLFGNNQGNSNFPPSKTNVKSSVFDGQSQVITKSARKPLVRRNPITGEEILIYPENSEKIENNDKEEINDNVLINEDQKNGDEEKKTEIPTKPIQTSIRVRNPPGGKSSGIFF